MQLSKLTLSNFKNYKDVSLKFIHKINCFVGNNGAGKTNILDAIHYLSFCKSYFSSSDTQNIRHEEDYFAIHGDFIRNQNLTDTISCVQKRNHKKQFKINQKEYPRLADHIGNFPLVMISPYDRDIINNGSEDRRKFFDMAISQFDKIYLDDIINYNKILIQRNALLKSLSNSNSNPETSLEIWNEQMAAIGHRIYEKRKDFLFRFIPVFCQYFEIISGSKEKVSISYESHFAEGDFLQKLHNNMRKELILQYSTLGSHKDDMHFLIDGYAVKKYGSQGQQKTFAVALKLAQFEMTKNLKGYKPILLLDDVFDKLDNIRVQQIIKLISEDFFGQVFITDTQKDRILQAFSETHDGFQIFEVIDGTINN